MSTKFDHLLQPSDEERFHLMFEEFANGEPRSMMHYLCRQFFEGFVAAEMIEPDAECLYPTFYVCGGMMHGHILSLDNDDNLDHEIDEAFKALRIAIKVLRKQYRDNS